MRTSTTSSTYPFPLRITMRGMPPAGRSGSRVGQKMIAPSNVQFFNKTWQHIGDKRTLARISLPKPDSIHANDDEQEDYRSECATGTAKVSDELTVSR